MRKFNIILFGIDTLRADHLGCYGHYRSTSPNIDNLAKTGVRFARCFSQAPKTAPSFMSIMTSRYPTYHGITSNIGPAARRGRVYQLDKKIPTIAEILKSQGYRTGAFTDGANLYAEIGFGRGFDYYASHRNYSNRNKMPGVIPEDEIKYWIRENAKENFFLFFHTFAAHNPWAVPHPYPNMFAPDYGGKLRVSPEFIGSLGQKTKRSPRMFFLDKVDVSNFKDIRYLKDIYDGAIKYVDDFIGNIIRLLAELKLDKETILVFTADHGEEFMDHGNLSHRQLYNELLHVPLIIKSPKMKSGVVINQTVRSIDIVPTVLGLLRIRPKASFQGVSLLDAANKNLGLPAIAEEENLGFSIIENDYKFIHPLYRHGARTDELYDLAADPKEKSNIIFENLDKASSLIGKFDYELHKKTAVEHAIRKILYISKNK